MYSHYHRIQRRSRRATAAMTNIIGYLNTSLHCTAVQYIQFSGSICYHICLCDLSITFHTILPLCLQFPDFYRRNKQCSRNGGEKVITILRGKEPISPELKTVLVKQISAIKQYILIAADTPYRRRINVCFTARDLTTFSVILFSKH